MTPAWLFAGSSYLAGSVPFGLLVARAVTGKDVRAVGSGNIGATNVARAAGRGAAIATLLLDALKGLGPVLLAARLRPDLAWLAPLCAVLAVLGHCFPVWLHFRGGKGVATGLGVALGLLPPAALAGGVTWLVLYRLLKISSIASLAGVTVALVVTAFSGTREALIALSVIAALILLRHQGNLRRLLRREEK
jgi:acyl phosphate:glycerol-3-phosphate acyltransferase